MLGIWKGRPSDDWRDCLRCLGVGCRAIGASGMPDLPSAAGDGRPGESGAADGDMDSFCDSILAQIATAGLLAAPRSRQEAARSLRKATAFLAAPHQAVMMISPSLHCTAQAASQLERTTRNDAEPGGAGIPAGP